jgi:hypothetical protein
MANLRANKITSTEVFETTGSVQFDGSGDYLTTPDNSNFNLGTGNFTIECFVYLKDITSNGGYVGIVNRHNYYTSTGWGLWKEGGGKFGFWYNAVSQINGTTDVEINKWYHIAAVRNESTISLYVNGTLEGSTTNTSFNDASTSFGIGAADVGATWNSSYPVNGHISNLRIIKGQALYTKNFTPPTRELTVISNTVLLACQSTTNTAQEATGKTITVNGNAVANELTPGLLTDVVKSGGTSAITGSVEFDGTGDYLQVTPNSDLSLTGDFTVEYWVYMSKSEPNMRQISSANYFTAGKNGNWYFGINNESGGNVYFYTYDGQSNDEFVGAAANTSLNSWYHIAAVRVGTTVTLFVNGISIGSGTISKSLVDGADGGLQIGRLTIYGDHYGFISNLRVIKGTALYTSNFIPPTRELKKVPGTVLLCCKDSNDPTAEETGKTITPYGSLDRTDLGVELVTNGDFSNSTTGWTLFAGSQGGTISVNGSNQLVITQGSASADMYASQVLSTASGKIYIAYVTVVSTTEANYFRFKIGTSANSDNNGTTGTLTTAGTYKIIFAATSSTTYVTINSDQNANKITVWDNITVTKLDPGTKPAFTPQVGSDGSVEFAGPTKINSENYFYLPTGNTEDRGRGRGVFGGGYVAPTVVNTIDYITISSTGNAVDFGDTSTSISNGSSLGSSTRGVIGGYSTPTTVNTIEYITFATTSNTLDFGDLTVARWGTSSTSNNTRGIFYSGYVAPANVNVIDYITIASIGNATDFGDATTAGRNGDGCGSPVRGIFASGVSPFANTIEYLTISSTGNSQDFGDLTVGRVASAASSSPTRAIFAGGYVGPAGQLTNTIDYITISSTGNAQDFGDLTRINWSLKGLSNSIRGIIGGGYVAPVYNNNIDYVTISSTGNSQDFGDMTSSRGGYSACSDSHGGLG